MTSIVYKSSGAGVTKVELGNLLEKIRTNILGNLSSQLDVFQAKKKKEEVDLTLSIFLYECCKMHPLRELPLKNFDTCNICE